VALEAGCTLAQAAVRTQVRVAVLTLAQEAGSTPVRAGALTLALEAAFTLALEAALTLAPEAAQTRVLEAVPTLVPGDLATLGPVVGAMTNGTDLLPSASSPRRRAVRVHTQMAAICARLMSPNNARRPATLLQCMSPNWPLASLRCAEQSCRYWCNNGH